MDASCQVPGVRFVVLGIPSEHQRRPLVAKVEFHFDTSIDVPLKLSSKNAVWPAEPPVAAFTSPDGKEIGTDDVNTMSRKEIRAVLEALIATTP